MTYQYIARSNIITVHISQGAVYAVMGCQVDDKIMIVAASKVNTTAFECGKVKNRDDLALAIKKAVLNIDTMANTRTHSVVLVVSSKNLDSGNPIGVVPVENVLDNFDMARVLTCVKQSLFSQNDYYTAQYFLLKFWLKDANMNTCKNLKKANDDGLTTSDIKNAIGEPCQNIKAAYHLMGLPSGEYNQWCQIIKQTGIDSDVLMFDVIASARYNLLPSEVQRGILFIDIGKCLSKVAVYAEGAPLFTAYITKGGDYITDQIAQAYGMAQDEAESYKKRCTLDVRLDDKKVFFEQTYNGVHSGGVFNRYEMCQVVQAAYDELFAAIFGQIKDKLKIQSISEFCESGVVATGGASLMNGFVPYLQKSWQVKVKLANNNSYSNEALHHISVSTDLPKEDFAYVNQLILDKKMQPVLGALICSFSDETELLSNAHESLPIKNTSIWQKLNQSLDKVVNFVRLKA